MQLLNTSECLSASPNSQSIQEGKNANSHSVQCTKYDTREKDNVEGAQRRGKLMCRRIGRDVTKMERLRWVLKDE